ncbi:MULTISPECIES: GNAT family N-acetyltransferase [Micromonospora]|uniref:GNAT family N-acetyltransferase n=1 Tax=Micromonospora solifontis TaxID=2487138 RepID=A0ABX9WIR7_9ACTN|nr:MULTISPECIES: GNAT family N-acetyltransferase [Micromonospora]NES15654.1 GNAT family N-acetyltransferase [Micromonospora sp. PPF5-17B]NES35954.1 GNAT family N-acetyltransferase [Micromonospora solifontis]NES56973.1 GNAT family N-acetyltransferase [Micromonospora sp. PPF5-6]RNM00062.1 GNAT family N-acetyltransferase [Micromonospora solifontis]
MSDALIRPARPEDASAVVALRALVYPYLVRGVESTRRMIVQPPPGEDWAAWVAEADGRLVGWVSAYRNSQTSTPGVGEVSTLHVDPAHRRRGVGTALLDAALGHLRRIGATRVLIHCRTESLPFARRHGFTPSRELRYSALDLRPAPPMPEPPPGVRLLPAAGVDPRRIHRADAESSLDEPGDVPTDVLGYDLWHHEVWDNPGLDRQASTVAEVDGEVVALSLVKRDGDRMWSDFTGTVPGHRGRGLGRLTKQAALHRAAAAGVRIAYTSNDEANAPMLAINARLGYRPVDSQWSCRRRLS